MKIWTMIAAVFLLTTDRAQTANALRELVRPHESNETHFYEALDRTLKKEKNSGVDWAPLTSVGYVPSNSKRDGTFRKIEVKTRDTNLHVTQSRLGYYASAR